MHHQGDPAPIHGVYAPECGCGDAEIVVRTGEKFPACPRCPNPPSWRFVRSFPSSWHVLPPDETH